MPIFEVRGADGVYEVNAPDAAQAAAAVKKMGVQSSGAPVGNTAQSPETVQTQLLDPMGMPTGATIEVPKPVDIPYGQAMRNVGSTIDAGVRMAANGATFGLADKFAGGADYLTGNAPSYDAGVKAQRSRTDDIRTAHPVASAAAEMAGGLATGAGLIKNGVTLAGRVGKGLLPRVLGYGAEGAAYGGAQGAGNTYSDNASDYLKNAGFGALTGSAIGAGLPVAGSTIGAAYRTGSAFLGPRVEGAGRGASALLRGAAQADEAGLRGLGQLGPEAMLPDAGPAMLGLGQGAATGAGEGRTRLVNALTSRDQQTAQRLASSLDRNLGPAPIPSEVEAQLVKDRRAVGPAYDAAFGGSRAANTQKVADSLESMIPNAKGEARAAIKSIRDDLNITDVQGNTGVLDPDPRVLFAVRRRIDGMMNDTSNSDVQRVLGETRKLVDGELANSVPGIKAADAQYAELMKQSEALQRGQSILDGGKSAIRPQELAKEILSSSQPKGDLVGPSGVPHRMRQGARAEIDRIVGTQVNDLGALERTVATPQDWNYQKLGTVFGDRSRDAVAGDIAANRQFRDTYQKIVQGSQTAQRAEAAKLMEGAAGGNVPTDITATSLGLKAINGIAKILSGQSNATTRDEVGRLLATRGTDARRLAQMLLDSAQATNSNAQSIAGLISSPQWIAATAPAYGHR